MTSTYSKDLLHAISLEVMNQRGYDINNPIYRTEFDLDNTDSQISMVYEDVEVIVNFLEEYGYGATEQEYFDSCDNPVVDIYKPPSGFSVTSKTHVSLNKGSSFADLKRFVSQLELMQISDDTDIDGHLSYDLSFNDPIIDRISCGDCGYEDYLIIPNDH
jgi:hypothetical protein